MTDKTTQGVAKKMWDDLDFASEEAVNAEEATFDMIPRAESDARVAAAFEAAEKSINKGRCDEPSASNTALSMAVNRVRALTPDDARAALDSMLAEARRDAVETARQAVWDKLGGSQLAEQLCDAIDAAIRAEAEGDKT
jgi:hypothetical protein